ncbi:MAG: ATP synthase F0 subunit B [Candidatus Vogelbacteria bacterium RIFOXYD1_FULL_46_19]|uniref:ATP synthase subunit b n=1 Tax=Candidatus Vogelbacteria bacterium RIFOXYD1_FULL_46_19 TaxID=1802439 RepID=A0A1G2QHP4_9BACT|nr:MAG: ATP synthase F0 subunit B [Candidatus Vogelbacteria bacterium RIFOXYD1_FULL_46_19]
MDIGQILANIGFNWPVAVANLVNFLIIFYLLQRFVFKRVGQVLKDRQAVIAEGLAAAEEAKGELLSAEVKAKQIADEAKLMANQIVTDGHERAAETVKAATGKAEAVYQEIVERGAADVQRERQEAEKQVQVETARLIVKGLEKVLTEDFTDKKQEDLIARLIK